MEVSCSKLGLIRDFRLQPVGRESSLNDCGRGKFLSRGNFQNEGGLAWTATYVTRAVDLEIAQRGTGQGANIESSNEFEFKLPLAVLDLNKLQL